VVVASSLCVVVVVVALFKSASAHRRKWTTLRCVGVLAADAWSRFCGRSEALIGVDDCVEYYTFRRASLWRLLYEEAKVNRIEKKKRLFNTA